jgi:prevent-host-death family protein
MKLGLREANQNFARVIRTVRAGREVVLTDRGVPIAVIKPFRSEEAGLAAMRRMVDEGLVRPPLRKDTPAMSHRWRPVRLKGKPFSQTIIEEREDRI